MTRVLLIGENTFPFHRFDEKRSQFETILGDDFDFTTTIDQTELLDLDECDVIIDYLTDSTLTNDQSDALFSFVDDGGGYAGVHCAADLTTTADDRPSRSDPFPEFRDLIGGHFIGHPEQSEFPVRIIDADHPVTTDVADFSVYDEPYDLDWDDDVHVLAQMDHDDLGDVPVAWVTSRGDGRVFYCSLGHTDEAFEHDAVRQLLYNGVKWAARTRANGESG